MKLVADESVDGPVVRRLRRDGHDVMYVAEMQPGIADTDVLAAANREGRPLVTADKDFGELVFRLRQVTTGVVLIRLAGLSVERKEDIVSAALREHGHEVTGNFSVISPGVVRVRRRLD